MPQLLLILFYAGCFLLSLPLHDPQRVAAASPPISFSFDFTNKTSYNAQDLLSTTPVASFDTRFTFNITLVPRRNKGDGLAFFLVGYPSVLPLDSYGGAFGLMSGTTLQANGENRFIAVEFDTYNNTNFEPGQTMDHIGIDFNSVKHSVNTTNLPEFSLNGTMTASINFNSSTRMLVARLYFDDRPSMKPVEVSVQLPHPDTLLPPKVAVGFSAATGTGMELH